MTDREIIRHTVATLAYRAGKTIRKAPKSFANFKAGPSTKRPVEIVAHMGDLLDWGLTMLQGEPKWHNSTPLPWSKEVARFFRTLKKFDQFLASKKSIKGELTHVFQGPVADALTHTGQLAMLRRLSGVPMKGENYARGKIAIGRVGMKQTPANPKYEFD